MNLDFSDDDLAFQQQVRQFLAEHLPATLRERSARGLHARKDELVAWQQALFRQGWIAPNWPIEYGGTGWSLTRKYLFNREYFLGGAPQVAPFGIGMVGPVIYRFGSPAQKEKYLPRILRSEDWWCQGYSEPGAGSDLASLRTSAVRDGDDFVVNGQKIWTSYAHQADMMFCLVRTDTAGRAQQGISFLLIDMKSSGLTVRPIIGLDLEHTLNEVFFDDVRVPADNLVGELNHGWTYAKFLLGHERNAIARVARTQFQLRRLKSIAASTPAGRSRLLDDPTFRHRLAQVEVDLIALEYTELRYLSYEIAGHRPGPEPSMLKLRGAEVAQAVKTLLVDALGPLGLAYEPESAQRSDQPPIGPDHAHGIVADNLYQRAATIYGGTNEIQRNIIARLVLDH